MRDVARVRFTDLLHSHAAHSDMVLHLGMNKCSVGGYQGASDVRRGDSVFCVTAKEIESEKWCSGRNPLIHSIPYPPLILLGSWLRSSHLLKSTG